MLINSRRSDGKSFAALVSLFLLLLATPQFVGAQTNTFPASGSAGVGTTTPSGTKLHVVHNTATEATILAEAGSSMSPTMEFKDAAATPNRWRIGSGWTTTTDGVFFIYDKRQSAARMIIDTSGNVGIGTTSPASPAGFAKMMHLLGASNASYVVDAGGTSRAEFAVSATGGWLSTADNLPFRFGTNNAERMRIDSSGNVGIGTPTPLSGYKLDVNGAINASGNINSTGNITASGSISAKYQDVAEWVESSEQLAAATVVVLDQTKSNQVIASTRAYDTRVAGVISAQPGITLGEKGAGKVLVATTGRVKVMVDAGSGSVQVGDLLVTSDIAGVAKKSEPLLLGGVPIHRPGTLIGKALEPVTQGQRREILVLLSLQ